MKTIVLPTDFSKNSRNAINYAIEVFGDDLCKFFLVNSFKVPHADYSMLHPAEEFVERLAIEKLNKFRQNFLTNSGGTKIRMDCVSLYDDIPNVIQKVVKDVQADLVVMGTKGASGLKEVLMGSNTADVIKGMNCSVLAIPDKAKIIKPLRIVYATDYDGVFNGRYEDPQNDHLNVLREIARQFKSDVVMLHILKEGHIEDIPNATKYLESYHYLDELNPRHHFLKNDNIPVGIDDFLVGHQADMLVLLPRKHNLYEKIFHRSVTDKMAMHAEIPLLALR